MGWRSTGESTARRPGVEGGYPATRPGRVAPFAPERKADDGRAADTPLERLLVRTGERLVLVRLEDVDWIEGAGNYVELHADDAVYRHRATLRGLASRLEPRGFARIHRSILVNLDRVAELRPNDSGGGDVILRDGTALALSRRYRKRLLAQLAGDA